MRFLLFFIFISISIFESFSQDSIVVHGFVKEKFENYFIQNAKISVLVNDTNFYSITSQKGDFLNYQLRKNMNLL
jgi:hypothetical protein